MKPKPRVLYGRELAARDESGTKEPEGVENWFRFDESEVEFLIRALSVGSYFKASDLAIAEEITSTLKIGRQLHAERNQEPEPSIVLPAIVGTGRDPHRICVACNGRNFRIMSDGPHQAWLKCLGCGERQPGATLPVSAR